LHPFKGWYIVAANPWIMVAAIHWYIHVRGLTAGLAVGMMAVDEADSGADPAKATLGELEVIRLLLDRAANVGEALDLLESVNIDFSGGPPLHYFIADASGKSAVVEFVD
jgi:penicillin V acylase-like amidase (Ntn superfamily)